MKKIFLAFLLCLAGFSLLVSSPAFAADKESPAAAASQQDDDSSTAEDLGRWIGVQMKRATAILEDVLKGISEGFESTPDDSKPDEECSAEEPRAKKCKPPPAGKEKAETETAPESPGFLVRLLRWLF